MRFHNPSPAVGERLGEGVALITNWHRKCGFAICRITLSLPSPWQGEGWYCRAAMEDGVRVFRTTKRHALQGAVNGSATPARFIIPLRGGGEVR